MSKLPGLTICGILFWGLIFLFYKFNLPWYFYVMLCIYGPSVGLFSVFNYKKEFKGRQ